MFRDKARPQALREVDITQFKMGAERPAQNSLLTVHICYLSPPPQLLEIVLVIVWQTILIQNFPLSLGCPEDDGDWTGEHPGPQVSLRVLPSNRASPRKSFIVLIIIIATITRVAVAVMLC